MTHRFQRLTAMLAAVAILISSSAFAENRSPRRTAAEELAAEMERVFGPGRASQTTARRETDAPTILRQPAGNASVLEAMNRERQARGLSPLRLNDKLSLAARDRMDDMFAKNYFAHVSPDGIQPFVWAKKRGYRYRLIGENLAVGYRGTAVVDGWMRSPGHRENILQRSFDEVGIAIADGSPQHGYRGPTVVALYGMR